jgi:hypothetical protein
MPLAFVLSFVLLFVLVIVLHIKNEAKKSRARLHIPTSRCFAGVHESQRLSRDTLRFLSLSFISRPKAMHEASAHMFYWFLGWHDGGALGETVNQPRQKERGVVVNQSTLVI